MFSTAAPVHGGDSAGVPIPGDQHLQHAKSEERKNIYLSPECDKRDGEGLFTGAAGERTRRSGFKLNKRRFRVDVGREFLPGRV